MAAAAVGAEAGDDDGDVECIVDRRVLNAGGSGERVLLKVRWRGASAAEDEWFPREDLFADFPAKVQEFERGLGKK